MITVRFLPRAEKDFVALSENLRIEILEKVELLSQFPNIGQKMDDAYKNYRYLLAGKNQYRIIYKVTSSTLVEVAYIRHCRRQMGLRLIH